MILTTISACRKTSNWISGSAVSSMAFAMVLAGCVTEAPDGSTTESSAIVIDDAVVDMSDSGEWNDQTALFASVEVPAADVVLRPYEGGPAGPVARATPEPLETPARYVTEEIDAALAQRGGVSGLESTLAELGELLQRAAEDQMGGEAFGADLEDLERRLAEGFAGIDLDQIDDATGPARAEARRTPDARTDYERTRRQAGLAPADDRPEVPDYPKPWDLGVSDLEGLGQYLQERATYEAKRLFIEQSVDIALYTAVLDRLPEEDREIATALIAELREARDRNALLPGGR